MRRCPSGSGWAALVSVGAIAVAVALALRLNGMSQWIMWEVSALFENIGVIHDGMEMMAKEREVRDREGARELDVSKGEIVFDDISFNYGKDTEVSDHMYQRVVS